MEVMMSTQIDLQRVERQVFRDTVQDGLTELLAGIMLIATGLFRRLNLDGGAGLVTVFLLWPGYRVLKRRLTYPRTGYVELVQERPWDLVRGMLVYSLLVFGMVVVALVLRGEFEDATDLYRWIPVLVGLLISGGFIYLGSKSGLARYYVLIALLMASGLLFSLLNIPSSQTRLSLYLLTIGGLLLLVGVGILFRFVRQNPVLEHKEVADVRD
jgi:hypothetical protein